MKHTLLIRVILVSTVISGILFVHFCIVDHATDKSSFLFMMSWLIKKVPVERESSLSLRGYEVAKKVWYGRKMVDYTKMNKKNSRCYSRDYCYAMWHGLRRPPGGLPSLFLNFFQTNGLNFAETFSLAQLWSNQNCQLHQRQLFLLDKTMIGTFWVWLFNS